MAFFIMKQDTLIEGSATVDALPDHMDALEWKQGKLMEDPGELVLDLSYASGDYRGSIIEGLITLFHRTLKTALEEQGVDNVSYYPVRLRDQNTGDTEGGYWIANVIGTLDCMDVDKSKLRPSASGMRQFIESLVIDPNKTNSMKLFRIKDKPSLLIINQELKDYFDRTDMLVGVDLMPTEDYSDW